MKFWSNVEKEYNELFGGEEGDNKQENKDESAMESNFNTMLTDMTKDLKKVPKDDLLPGLASIPVASDSEDEDGEFDEEDGKKALKIEDKKKKGNKKCQVGDKSYEIGERWKDPKTGRDMICILMNIPKDVQPKLEEADVTITKDEVTPEAKESDLKPKTSGPQWEYTNRKSKTKGCSSDKEIEKPDPVGSEAVKDESQTQQEEQVEDSDNGLKPLGELNILDKETDNLDKDDTQEEQSGDDAGNSTEKDSDSKENNEKESDDRSEEKHTENEEKSERLEENDDIEDTGSDTDSEEERRQAAKDNQSADESDEYEEREEDKVKYKTESRQPEINVTAEDREIAVVRTDEPEKNTVSTDKRPDGKEGTVTVEEIHKEVPEHNENHESEAKPDSEEILPTKTHEKGQTIYTKETTVTQRKLFKTSETTEIVETEKNVD